jgi:hypothetical protein
MSSRFLSKQAASVKLQQFNDWLGRQTVAHRIVIAGNHDRLLEHLTVDEIQSTLSNAIYLCNSSVTVAGLIIWGSPLSIGASHNNAFQSSSFAAATQDSVDALLRNNDSINNKPIDILVTHGPNLEMAEQIRPRLAHISGHFHAFHGVYKQKRISQRHVDDHAAWLTIAAPIMNTRYEPRQLPIVLDIDLRQQCESSLDSVDG